MEHPSQEDQAMPVPLNSTFGRHGHGQAHIIYPDIIPSPLSQIPTNVPFKKATKYKECLKNHAASMGGNAIDGCGEFMPNGKKGTIEALTCSACSCHRNFHRKEIKEEPSFHDSNSRYHHNVTNPSTIIGRKVFLRPHQMFMCSCNMESQDEGDGHGSAGGVFAAKNSHLLVKKRFRTKFTQRTEGEIVRVCRKSWLEHAQARRRCGATVLLGDWRQKKSTRGLNAQ